MPMDLLEELADAKLPVRVTDPFAVDKLRILEAAGYLLSDVPERWRSPDEECPAAAVLGITPLGHKALRYFAPHGPPRSGAKASLADLIDSLFEAY